jgi:TetR/AcrR family transcriptional regulator, cholesterol catabolism regulator
MSAKSDLRTNDTKEHILKEAQRLYHEGGYSHMALDKIAKILDIKRPAVYYHFPGGKEELFREMVDQIIEERLANLNAAIQKGTNTQERLEKMIWTIVENPMMDIRRTLSVEMNAFENSETRELLWQKLGKLRTLLMSVFEEAVEKGEFRQLNLNLVFFSFLTLCDMCEHLLHTQKQFPQMQSFVGEDKQIIIGELLNNWLNGVTVRSI